MNEPLAEMFRYNRWANLRLLEDCNGLPDDQLDQLVPGTFGSIRSTLLHLVSGQDVFIARLRGEDQFETMRLWAGWPGFEMVLHAAITSSDALIAIAESTDTDEFINQGFQFEGQHFAISKSFLLTHALTHAAEHRSQVVTALSQLGVIPPNLDGWAYAEDSGAVRRLDEATV